MTYATRNYFQYVPVSRSNLEWDLYLTGAGMAEIGPGESYPPAGHPATYDFNWGKGRVLPEYQVLYISEGAGLFESAELGPVEIKAEDVILLFPGQWHRYKPSADVGWKEYWISWNGEYLYRLTRRGQMGADRAVLPIQDGARVLELHARILSMLREHPGENSRVLAAVGMEILATVLESSGEKPLERTARRLQESHPVEDKVVADAMQLIWSHGYRITSVAQLAARLPVTRRTLERRFKLALGRSIGQEFTRCRIARAKQLLESTKLPIEHIAMAVGYCGAARLGKAFQRIENVTPRAYRKRYGKA